MRDPLDVRESESLWMILRFFPGTTHHALVGVCVGLPLSAGVGVGVGVGGTSESACAQSVTVFV